MPRCLLAGSPPYQAGYARPLVALLCKELRLERTLHKALDGIQRKPDGCPTVTLAPGHYALKYKICNWNKPESSPVELNIENSTGSVSIAKQTYTPTINIGNVASNSFGNLQQQSFEFDITEHGNYAIALYTADVVYGDCILGQLILTANSYEHTGIDATLNDKEEMNNNICVYDLQGRQVTNPRHGLYIKRSAEGKNGKKIFVR